MYSPLFGLNYDSPHRPSRAPWAALGPSSVLTAQVLLSPGVQADATPVTYSHHPARDPPETFLPPWVLHQPDTWVSCLNPQPSLVLAESLHSHLQHWDSGPSQAGRQRLRLGRQLASPLGLVSQGKSFASSICISLKLISGVNLETGARWGPDMKKGLKSLVQSRDPHNMYLFLLLGHGTSPWHQRGGQDASLAPSLGSAEPQVSHPSGCLTAPRAY